MADVVHVDRYSLVYANRITVLFYRKKQFYVDCYVGRLIGAFKKVIVARLMQAIFKD
tara:strand:+ start:782 stop:952 length:171 start_codon:yes stop_codon:yes gene_type:complete